MRDLPSKFEWRVGDQDLKLADSGEITIVAYVEYHGTKCDLTQNFETPRRKWRRGDLPDVSRMAGNLADRIEKKKEELNSDPDEGTFAIHSIIGRIVTTQGGELWVSSPIEVF